MQRKAGIFLHPTSLPSPFGIGDLGEAAYHWIDLLVKYGQSLWQICPLGPIGYGYSPYNCHSSFAGNHLLLSPETLMQDGLLLQEELDAYPRMPDTAVDFSRVIQEKEKLYRKAFARFAADKSYERFCEKERFWLDDYALFMMIKKVTAGLPWDHWERSLKMREPDFMQSMAEEHQDEIRYHTFLQYQFFRQWHTLHEYAQQQGIALFGDLPYYVALDSSDVWASDGIFKLDKVRQPVYVGGVPPDYFSASGQLWGNPVYDWDTLKQHGYTWWVKRIRSMLEMVDWIRIDHFRGFEAFWQVRYGSANAINGAWIHGPGMDFFTVLKERLGSIPLVAEDLGMITEEVDALRTGIGIPGMRVMQFAFDGDDENPHRPQNITRDTIMYTGTHDNDTTVGWLAGLSEEMKETVCEYLTCTEENVLERIMHSAYFSPSDWCILPLQDVLLLDSSHRMNRPGTARGNWAWRFTNDMIDGERFAAVADYTVQSGRE